MVNAPQPPDPPPADPQSLVSVIATETVEGATTWEIIAWICSAPEPSDGRAQR